MNSAPDRRSNPLLDEARALIAGGKRVEITQDHMRALEEAGEADPFGDSGGDGDEAETSEESGPKRAAQRRWYREVAGDWMPRWLPYSGASRVLSLPQWAIWTAIVRLDHACMGRRTSRRTTEGLAPGRAFAAPTTDVIAQSGCAERTLRREIPVLRGCGLLDHYSRGRGKPGGYVWPEFAIGRELLMELYVATAPRIVRALGGIANTPMERIPENGLRIYGFADLPGEIVVPWERLYYAVRAERRPLGDRDLGRLLGQ